MKTHRVRRAGVSSEDGVTLIELMLALVILGVVLSGIVAGAISALRVTQINDQRAVATNLAQAEIERTRSLPFETLQGLLGQEERTHAADRGDYRIVREISWTGIDSATDACLEDGDSIDAAVLRVDVAVSPLAAPDRVSTSTTAIARPPVNPADDVGALSVRVTDHQTPAVPVDGVVVTVRGPDGSGLTLPTQVTPTSGCVLFLDLAVGNYEVQIVKAGHVGAQPGPNESEPLRTGVGVAAGTRTALDFSYAPEADLQLVGESVDGSAVAVPDLLPVSIERDLRVKRSAAGEIISPLWPGTWSRWAGDCSAADPMGVDTDGSPFWPGAQRQDPVVLDPSALTTGAAHLAPISIDLPSGDGTYTIRAVATRGCDEGTQVLEFSSPIAAGSTALIGLPYGFWSVQFSLGAEPPVVYDVAVDPRLDWADGPIPLDELGTPSSDTPAPTTYVVDSVGMSSVIVPPGVTELTVWAWGGGGGSGAGGLQRAGGDGGGGGYASATVAVIPGETLLLYVGGGGGGGSYASAANGVGTGGGGGGFSGIFRDTTPLVVAAGGGGGGGGDNQTGSTPDGGAGGAAGGSSGSGGTNAGPNGTGSVQGGFGGSQDAGGAGGSSGSLNQTFGLPGAVLAGGRGGEPGSNAASPAGAGGTNGGAAGGRASTSSGRPGGGGGGAGWFGGGGGQASNDGFTSGAGGGGGSSFVTGTGASSLPGNLRAPGGAVDNDRYDGVAGVGGLRGAAQSAGAPGARGLLVVSM